MTTPAPDQHSAREQAKTLVLTLREATQMGVPRILRTQATFEETLLAPNYRWSQWRSDNTVDRELRRYFMSLTHKAPYLEDVPTQDQAAQAVDGRWEGQVAVGLSIAYYLQGLGISLPSDPKWVADWLTLEVFTLDEEGEVVEQIGQVAHASQPAHVQNHYQFWKQHAQWATEWQNATSPEAQQTVILALAEQIEKSGLPPSSGEAYTKNLATTQGLFHFQFGSDFTASLQRNGKLSLELVLETCARVCLGCPKELVKPLRLSADTQAEQRQRTRDGARAWRTHLTKANEGFRLLFWTTPQGNIEFANVGPKKELFIAE